MTLTIFFTIIIVHWISDFIMQDEKWALGKSKNWTDLLSHTIVYSFTFTFLLLTIASQVDLASFSNGGIVNWIAFVKFAVITFVCHTTTDYFTSRKVSKLFAAKIYGTAIPNIGGFSVIGFDQVLHYTQLALTICYL